MIPIKIVRTFVLVGATLALSAPNAAASTKPLIVSGVSEWGALAHQLVGNDATVVSLLSDPNADPHEHEATVADAANVARADVVLENGAGYDSWLLRLVKGGATRTRVINVATLMHVSSGGNPHFFYDPVAAIRFVKTLGAVLVHRSGFGNLKVRESSLLAALKSAQSSVAGIAETCGGVKVAATEDVTSYLLRDAGLDIVTPEALRLAIGNGVDPSVKDLATALDQLKDHPAFLIDNIQTSTPLTAAMVAQATTSHVAIIRVTETMKGRDYVRFLDGVIAKIRSALRAHGCLK